MSRWWSRWRVASRIARRDALRHKGRTTLVVVMLALPVAAGVYGATVYRSGFSSPEVFVAETLGPEAQAALSWGGCVVDQDVRGLDSRCPQGHSQLGDPSSEVPPSLVPDGDVVSERIETYTAMAHDQAGVSDAMLNEVEQVAAQALAPVVVGRPAQQPGELVVDRELAERLAVEVGDDVTIDMGRELAFGPKSDQAEQPPVDAIVVGIVADDGPADAFAFPGTLGLGEKDELHDWVVTGPNPVTWEDVQQWNAAGYRVTSRDVVLDPPAEARPARGPYDLDRGFAAYGIVVALGAFGLLEVVMLCGPAFAVGARRSRRMLALVAASGGAPADLRRVVLANGLVCGLVAGVVGSAVGAGAGIAMVVADRGARYVSLPWREAGLLTLVGGVIGLVAALVPARAAARADTLAALAGRPEVPRSRRRRSIGAVGVGVLGLALVGVGLIGDRAWWAVAGMAAIEVAVLLGCGALTAGLSRLAGHLGLASRLALRDAARHRPRTAPAIAAIIACVTVGVLALTWLDASKRASDSLFRPEAAPGAIALGGAGQSLADATTLRDDIVAEVPGASFVPVSVGALGVADGEYLQLDADASRCDAPTTDLERWQCGDTIRAYSDGEYLMAMSSQAALVDDGTVVSASRQEGAHEAAAALADGIALTNNPLAVNDGMVTVQILSSDYDVVRSYELPAQVVDWRASLYDLVLPPATAADLGFHVEQVGYLGSISGGMTDQDRSRLTALMVEHPTANAWIIEPRESRGVGTAGLALALAALVVAAGATWVAVGLAAVDARPDLTTLSAVGASPSLRRRYAAAQAAVVAVIGTLVGVVMGFLVAATLIVDQIRFDASMEWSLEVPWVWLAVLAVGIPAIAMAGAYLTTRSRLPLVRRVAM